MLIYQRALSKWVGGHPKHSYKCWNQTWLAGKSSMKFRDVSGHVSEDRRENPIGFVQSRNNLWITTEKSKSPFWQVKSYQIPLNHHFGRWNLKALFAGLLDVQSHQRYQFVSSSILRFSISFCSFQGLMDVQIRKSFMSFQSKGQTDDVDV